VLARAESAAIDLPPFPSSAMDGYAFAASSLGAAPPHVLILVGESLAGHPFRGKLGRGECLRITTGAAVPDTCDIVVPLEDCATTTDRVTVHSQPDPGANIRMTGSDVSRNQPLLSAGTPLGPFDLAWLAACGTTEVEVFVKPEVAFFSTGDELRDPPEPLTEGQIYDSNRQVIAELLSDLPVSARDLGILPDEPESLRSALGAAAPDCDLILTTGGVSVGTADYLKEIVAELGSLDLWRLNLKPGKPLAFGHIAGTPFMGLPGNPVSTIVTFLLLAKPALMHLAGALPRPATRFQALLSEPIRHAPGREEYQRGRFELDGAALTVRTTGDQSSNRLATFSGADCLIRIPKDTHDLPAGTSVEVLPFRGIVG
jgi:molybdopterin molybdotransferase